MPVFKQSIRNCPFSSSGVRLGCTKANHTKLTCFTERPAATRKPLPFVKLPRSNLDLKTYVNTQANLVAKPHLYCHMACRTAGSTTETGSTTELELVVRWKISCGRPTANIDTKIRNGLIAAACMAGGCMTVGCMADSRLADSRLAVRPEANPAVRHLWLHSNSPQGTFLRPAIVALRESAVRHMLQRGGCPCS